MNYLLEVFLHHYQRILPYFRRITAISYRFLVGYGDHAALLQRDGGIVGCIGLDAPHLAAGAQGFGDEGAAGDETAAAHATEEMIQLSSDLLEELQG